MALPVRLFTLTLEAKKRIFKKISEVRYRERKKRYHKGKLMEKVIAQK